MPSVNTHDFKSQLFVIHVVVSNFLLVGGHLSARELSYLDKLECI